MQTNREVAAHDPFFRRCCEVAGIQPSKRQASKWGRRSGLAYNARAEAQRLMREEAEKAAKEAA